MLRLSKLADYAIVILAAMAQDEKKQVTAIHMADVTTLPAPTVAKILKKLAKNGLLTATRGAAGGYKLSKPAQAITAGAIIEAIDGPIRIIGCISGAKCGRENSCVIHGRWDPINNAVREAFTSVSLIDLLGSHYPHAVSACATG